jgi:sigma-B regulation protein RsbU (phosphoserine phosphatase)
MILLLSLTSVVGVAVLRETILRQGRNMGNLVARDSEAAMRDQVQQQLMELAQSRAAMTDEKLRVIQNQTQSLSSAASRIYTYKSRYQPVILPYLWREELQPEEPFFLTVPGISLESVRDEAGLLGNTRDIMRQITFSGEEFTSYIGGESGYFIVVDSGASASLFAGFDHRLRPWYTGAKEKNGLFWTPSFPDIGDRGATIACAMPVYDFSGTQPVLKGVAATGALLSKNVDQIIASVRVGETGYAFILDGDGQMIRRGNYPGEDGAGSGSGVFIEDYLHGKDSVLRELAARMFSEESGLTQLEIEGREMYVAWYSLKLINWSLGVIAPVDEVIAPARHIESSILSLVQDETFRMDRNIRVMFFTTVLVILFATLAAVFFSIRLSNSLAAPIVALSDGAQIISAGDLNHRLAVKGTGEIVLLAETINQMVANIQYVSGEKERIDTELNIAAQIQTSILPGVFPPFPYRTEFDIYAEMHPAKEVGGDFYDFFLIDPNRVMTLIADVSGKGVPAALFMVIAKTLLKNHGQMDKPLDEIFSAVNNQLCENNDANMFVTVFACVLDLRTGLLCYANAGHNRPLLSRSGGDYEFLELKRGLPMGVQEDFPYSSSEITLSEGDRLYLYTDGVNEAENPQGEQFGNQRLLDAANRCRDLPIREFDLAFRAGLSEFVNGAEQSDDITTLVLAYKKRVTIHLPAREFVKIEL